MRILVVDDNVDAANSLASLMRATGHEVSVEYDGRSAVHTAKEWRPQVVLLDIGLPGMDGYEVAREIRALALGDGPLIVAISGYDDAATHARAAGVGIDLHFSKTADVRSIQEAVTMWDGKRQDGGR